MEQTTSWDAFTKSVLLKQYDDPILRRWHQIEVFKISNGYENIDSNIVFSKLENKITRGQA